MRYLTGAKKLGSFVESSIRELSDLSEEYGAINLTQGLPDFAAPPKLVEAAVEAVRRGSNQYSSGWGHQGLREALARKYKEYNGIDADPEKDITVTCGSTEAIAAAVLGLADPGDRVIVTDPFYENYVPDAVLAGCQLDYVPYVGRDLTLDQDALKVAMAKHPKIIIINTPNNPTGKVMSRDQLKLVADLCEEENVIAITDEIYEHITYDGVKHISLATLDNMHERTITVSGASKTYSVTGWRVGWALAEGELTDALRKVHDYLSICAPAPFQEALITGLNFPSSYYGRLSDAYDRKRRAMMKTLDEAELEYHRPEGAYYILANVPEEYKDDAEFSNYLLKKIGIAVLPASAFYHNKTIGKRKIRIAYCKKDATLQEARRLFGKLREKAKQKISVKSKA